MTDTPERLNAALEGRYRIEREVGEGGMATVYLADDVRHGRKVALKVLRPELAAVVGGERFLAEIRTTAALQHPHILPLHDSGEADSFLFYVMPYVEGESLRERIERDRQLPVDEAVDLARKVADALQYAHEEGVVHRDIKPANILLSRGQPLVADFGIALAVSQAGGGRITETGLSLGTPHYMSPEQAAGERTLDRRSDVYALGCILYEMLAGQPPYGGPTAQSVLAQILTEQPRRVTDFRPTVPPHVAAVVAKALEKLPADRFESAEAFREALGDPGFSYETRTTGPGTTGTASSAGGALAAEPPRRQLLLTAGALVVVLATLAAWGWLRPTAAPGPITMVRLAIPDSQAPVPRPNPRMDISPDGRSLVYVGPSGGGGMLWYRPLGQLDARPLLGTDGANTPVFSPDGRSVAYATGTPGDLKVVGLDGEPPVTVLRDSAYAYGMAWSDDGWLYITDNERVRRIRAQGGRVEIVTGPDQERAESWRGWPHALPGGEYLLFQTYRGVPDSAEIGIRNLNSGEEAMLAVGIYPLFAHGHLVFTRTDGTVMAAPLDPKGLRLRAEPSAVFGSVAVNAGQAYAEMALSRNGTLLYGAGGRLSQELVWVDRDGTTTPVDTAFSGSFVGISLSPDGSRIATGATTQGGQSVWVKRLAGGPWRRVTFESGRADRPAWVPSGDAVSYIANLGQSGRATLDVWVSSADGTGDPRVALDLDDPIEEVAWSPDGRWLVYRVGPGGDTRRDLYALDVGGSGDTIPLAATRFDEHSPAVSRDGGWLAFVSDESGRAEVFVRPFPEVGGGKWQVSTDGGTEPVWSRGGNELFYRAAGTGAMMAARYVTDPSFAVQGRSELFPTVSFISDPVHQTYDVTPDGQRFLMARDESGYAPLVLVQNWFQELVARVEGAGR